MKQDIKHVLIVPSWYPSSYRTTSGIFFKEQAEILSKRIEKVGVIAPLFKSFKDFIHFRNLYKNQKVNGVNTLTKELWHYPKLEKINENNWLKSCKFLFEKYIQEYGMPDILHIHSVILAGFFAKYVKEKYGIPYVITEHATGFALGTYDKKLEEFRKVVQSSTRNIAVSENLSRVMSEKVGGKWEVIPNTIVDVFFKRGKENLPLKNSSSKSISFFTLSNLTPIKGLGFLLEAISEISKQYPDIHLFIGGKGIELPNLKKIVKEKAIAENVTFLGSLSRERVMEEYAKADFYISPSLQETFGVVVIEALAFGLPCVVTRCGGPEYIVDNTVGIVVEKGNSRELVMGMKQVIENRNQYDPETIIRFCEERYSENVVSQKIINVYKEVLNG